MLASRVRTSQPASRARPQVAFSTPEALPIGPLSPQIARSRASRSPVRSYKQSNMSANTVGHFVATTANGSWQMHFDYVDGSTIQSSLLQDRHWSRRTLRCSEGQRRSRGPHGRYWASPQQHRRGRWSCGVGCRFRRRIAEAGGAISPSRTRATRTTWSTAPYVYLVTLVADENGANPQEETPGWARRPSTGRSDR